MTTNVKRFLLKLYCPEGWRTAGWQRCIAISAEFGQNVSGGFVEKFNNSLPPVGEESPLILSVGSPAEMSFFVESGESFTMDAFADVIRGYLNYEVEIHDGEQP